MDDTLAVLLVQPLSSHQAGRHQSGVLPHPGQELPIDALLEAQSLVAINKLCVLQHFGVLAAFSWRGLRTAGQGGFIITLPRLFLHCKNLGGPPKRYFELPKKKSGKLHLSLM